MVLPKARQDKLIVRELPNETLLYDHVSAKAHCLNQTAAWSGSTATARRPSASWR